MARTLPADEKPSLSSYPLWLRRRFRSHKGLAEGKAYYDAVTLAVADQFNNSVFWRRLGELLPDIETRYSLQTGYGLLTVPERPRLDTKAWDAFLAKTYRRNILRNDRFPDPPAGGWLLPPEWFSEIKDLVRTTFVVKYMDGVHELGLALEDLAKEIGLGCESTLEATAAGYFAGHVVVTGDFAVPSVGWQVNRQPVSIELQVTTQVQEVIRALLHRNYELDRMRPEDDEAWKWDPGSRSFAANYLGHILHYVEGRIMNIRELDREATES